MTTVEHKPDGPPLGVGVVGTPRRPAVDWDGSFYVERVKVCNLQIRRLPGLVTLKCDPCGFLAELIPGATNAETEKLTREAAAMHGKEA